MGWEWKYAFAAGSRNYAYGGFKDLRGINRDLVTSSSDLYDENNIAARGPELGGMNDCECIIAGGIFRGWRW